MQERFKKVFPMTKLKQKFNRFRAKWKLFKELIDSTGFAWDPERNTVDATEEDWAKKITANKEYKQFRKRGCDHFKVLGEIFNETIATGYLARSSTQEPLNFEEEQEVEEVFLHGTTKDPIFTDVDDISDSPLDKKSKKKRRKGDAHEGGSRMKNQCLDSSVSDAAWNAFKDTQLSKKLVYDKAGGPSKGEECVDILEKMEDIIDRAGSQHANYGCHLLCNKLYRDNYF